MWDQHLCHRNQDPLKRLQINDLAEDIKAQIVENFNKCHVLPSSKGRIYLTVPYLLRF